MCKKDMVVFSGAAICLFLSLVCPSFGFPQSSITSTPVYTVTQVSVATSSTTVISLTQPAKEATIQNISDTAISCNPSGVAAVANQGIVVESGGSIEFKDSSVPGLLTCIHAGTGTKTVNVIISR